MAESRIVKKLELAENTRYCQAGFEDAMLGVTRRFLGDVTWRYASGPHGPLLPSSLDFIRIGFFHHTGTSNTILKDCSCYSPEPEAYGRPLEAIHISVPIGNSIHSRNRPMQPDANHKSRRASPEAPRNTRNPRRRLANREELWSRLAAKIGTRFPG